MRGIRALVLAALVVMTPLGGGTAGAQAPQGEWERIK